MTGSLLAEKITLEDFQDALSRYPEHVSSNELKVLDEYRFETLPNKIQDRWSKRDELPESQPILLVSKGELVELVTWKLKHGTFRPKLKQLAESNEESVVHKLMEDLSVHNGNAKAKMQLLTQLKGIGPATASLVLSCVWPTEYPFFSDELFRWIHWDGRNADGSNSSIKSGKGWSRPISYTPKEYDSLILRCTEVQERLSGDQKLSFHDLEKVAFVLGKEKAEMEGVAAKAQQKQKRGIEEIASDVVETSVKRSRSEKPKVTGTQSSGTKTRQKKN